MQVKLVDAAFVWTEPHSRRLKMRLRVQREVQVGAVLEQAFVVEWVLVSQACPDCQRVAANDLWIAVAQVRQHVRPALLWILDAIAFCLH